MNEPMTVTLYDGTRNHTNETLPAGYTQLRSPVIRWLFWRSVLAPWSHLHDLGDSQQAVQTNKRKKEKRFIEG